DIVNALPVLSALRAHWPNAWIAWVVNRNLRELLEGHPELDEVIPFDRAGGAFGLRGGFAALGLMASLRKRRFDLAIDLQGLLRSGIMTAATGARVRAGRGDAREGAWLFYTHRMPRPEPDDHAVDRLLPIARAFGANVDPPRFVLAVSEADRHWAREQLAAFGSPRLVLNMGARWPTKRWPPEHFAVIARRALARYGVSLVVVGAPEDRPTVDRFRELAPELCFLDLCGRTRLPQLAAILAEADLVVSNDTGPLHIATAAGARVVGIYTCTSPELNGPYGPRAIAVRTGVWCAASYLSRCNRLDCMTELEPERVWQAVKQQMEQGGWFSPPLEGVVLSASSTSPPPHDGAGLSTNSSSPPHRGRANPTPLVGEGRVGGSPEPQ
ncbi:MAG TPA: glycosyltransferase family 9 protein, partial [Isosphaeraceae bacterium]|nr:glycosyltransferase family 9 protein [Isosphaeraceae bacterium]